MSDIQVFQFKGADVRTVSLNGDPWWVAADVCAILGLAGPPAQHLRRLDADEKGVISIHTPGGWQDVTGVNESGLYSLMLGSKKAEARAVKKWLTSVVMPSIRKTGAYSVAPVSEVDKLAQLLGVAMPGMQTAIAEARQEAQEAKAIAAEAASIAGDYDPKKLRAGFVRLDEIEKEISGLYEQRGEAFNYGAYRRKLKTINDGQPVSRFSNSMTVTALETVVRVAEELLVDERRRGVRIFDGDQAV